MITKHAHSYESLNSQKDPEGGCLVVVLKIDSYDSPLDTPLNFTACGITLRNSSCQRLDLLCPKRISTAVTCII